LVGGFTEGKGTRKQIGALLSLTENRQARSCLTERLNELADAPMAELTRADLVKVP